MKKIVSSVIFAFVVSLAWGQGDEQLPVEFERYFLHGSKKILVKSEKVDFKDVLVRVRLANNVVFRYKSEFLEKRLRRLDFASPLLFLFWKTGVHGEVLSVLDVEKRKIIWEQFSTWPMALTIHKDRVRIEYTGGPLSEGRYEEFTKILHLQSKKAH